MQLDDQPMNADDTVRVPEDQSSVIILSFSHFLVLYLLELIWTFFCRGIFFLVSKRKVAFQRAHFFKIKKGESSTPTFLKQIFLRTGNIIL